MEREGKYSRSYRRYTRFGGLDSPKFETRNLPIDVARALYPASLGTIKSLLLNVELLCPVEHEGNYLRIYARIGHTQRLVALKYRNWINMVRRRDSSQDFLLKRNKDKASTSAE